MGELSRMTQYKDKTKHVSNELVGAGLFCYPVLMAADILLYGTHVVPIGDDQRQHLELARDIAERFNNFVGGSVFVVPEPIIPKVGARVMSLQDPTQKMSKSDKTPLATVYLLDGDDVIAKKIRSAVTDSGSEITDDPAKPGVRNLVHINAAVTDRTIEAVVEAFKGRRYGELKAETADAVIAKVGPIRRDMENILSEPAILDCIIRDGAEQASMRARQTLARVYDAVGFIRKFTV
jgi:tryptophanyl-tRNA synthetase